MKSLVAMVVGLFCVATLFAQDAGVDQYQATTAKGLGWLVKQQAKDGSWSGQGQWSTSMTAFAGLALLADGNTLTEGRYAPQLRSAVAWFRKQQPADAIRQGQLGNGEQGRYMPEHGVALSFLAQVYNEADGDERVALAKMLHGGVEFSVKGQASFGGWFYTSAAEGHDAAENVATMLQLQGLIDARNAGIPVPSKTLKKALSYLHRCTTARGGIAYSGGANTNVPAGGERPTITAMALAAFLRDDGSKFATTRQWLTFCADDKAFAIQRLIDPADPLLHYFLCKAVFHLNHDDWKAAFPDKEIPAHLTWTKYRKTLFDHLRHQQKEDGSWPAPAWGISPVFNTSLPLNILLYEKAMSGRPHHR